MYVIAELYNGDIGHGVPIALSSTLGIALSPAYPQNVHRTTVSSEEAAVVVAVGVDATVETFWGTEGEFHSVFVAHLAHWRLDMQSVQGQILLRLLPIAVKKVSAATR